MKNFQGNPPSDTILSFMRIATKLVEYMCQLVMMVTTYIPRFSLKVVFCHFVRISCSMKFVRTCTTPINITLLSTIISASNLLLAEKKTSRP